MKVSVILTVLNEGPGMADLLDALLAQTAPPDEIVVVDGGSTDDTLKLITNHAQGDPRLKVHVEPGVNVARSRNIATSRAEGTIGGRFIPVAQGRFGPASLVLAAGRGRPIG